MSKPTENAPRRRGRRKGAREPFSDEPAVVYDQLALPLVIRDRESKKFVKLSQRSRRGGA